MIFDSSSKYVFQHKPILKSFIHLTQYLLARIYLQFFQVVEIPHLNVLIQIQKELAMSRPVCPLHAHPQDLVCAQASCLTVMCDQCFPLHHSQSKHALTLILDHSSIGYFLEFSQYLISTFDQTLQKITCDGFRKFFEVKIQNGKFAISQQSEAEITSLCLQVLSNYRNIVFNNRAFVSDNINNFAVLHHRQFLQDFTVFLLENWGKIGLSLAQQLKVQLIKAYPYRLSYKHTRFTLKPDVLAEIELARQSFLEKIKHRTFVSIEAVQKKAVSEESIMNQAKIWEEIRTVPHSMKLVDSFEEIMQGSFLSCDQNDNLKQILEQSVETLSPNIFSLEQMQKQIQLLLIQNQSLKQQNYSLRFQNQQLRQQNSMLKQGRAF